MATAIAAVYIFMPLRFRPTNIDDPWYMSFIYNYAVNHIETDAVFGQVPQNGMAGTELFGKIYAGVYGLFFTVFGWEKRTGFLLSSIFVYLSSLLWYYNNRLLGFTYFTSVVCSMSMLLMTVFFAAGNAIRPEAFILFLCTLSLFFGLRNRYFLALLFSGIAFEAHPVGFLSAFSLLALFIRKENLDYIRRNTLAWKFALSLLAGIVCFFATYLLLHYRALHIFKLMLSAGRNVGKFYRTFLFVYFYNTRFNRNVLEMVALAAALAIFIRNKLFYTYRFELAYFVLNMAYPFLLGRDNFNYTVLIFPSFLPIAFRAAESASFRPGFIRSLAVLIVLFYLPQYPVAAYINRNLDFNGEYLSKIRDVIPRDGAPIFGAPYSWFAFKDRQYYYQCYGGTSEKFGGLAKAWLIVHENDPDQPEKGCGILSWLSANFDKTLYASYEYKHRIITVFRLVKKK